jgi:protein-glutamine gamma-glutamyltransferase
MIKISGKVYTSSEIKNSFSTSKTQANMIDILVSSEEVYGYISLSQLKFELDLRTNIIASAREIDKSNVQFSIFRKSRCNTAYWERESNGGFVLKDGIKASTGIMDIFINSAKYATECATVIVIIYYKALLNMYKETLFNELYPEIELMNWENLDENLAIRTYRSVKDYLPGDCRYFKNPDVNPITPEWQGENAIDMDYGLYFGHGIGIRTQEQIIRTLNKKRKAGAAESAYLTSSVTRQNYKYLAGKTAL